ncbi:MAG: YtxH domain-containing protein [Nitrospira sp.]|nr:YtxH domain-containing protein [Nitrospira sp.]
MRNGNYSDEEMEDATGWLAFVAGALIGVGLALLFAPQPGSELRGMLHGRINRAKDDLMDKGQEAWDTAVERGKEYHYNGEGTIRDVRRSAKGFAMQGQQTMRDVGRSAREFAKRGQNVVEEAANEASRNRG